MIYFYKSNADQEASNVSKPGHATTKADVEHLEQEPKAKDNGCRYGNDPDEIEEKDECQNPRPWVENQVSTQNTGYSATCPNHWNLGIGVKDDMGQAGSQP